MAKARKSAGKPKDEPKSPALEAAEREAQEAARASDANVGATTGETPPRLSQEQAEAADTGSGDEGEGEAGTPAGETDPDSVPTIQRESTAAEDLLKGGQPPQFDPNRAASEGEVAANTLILETKGDTGHTHPSDNAGARANPEPAPENKEGGKEYFLMANIGSFRPAPAGQPMRVVTQSQLMIPDTSMARHLSRGALVPK